MGARARSADVESQTTAGSAAHQDAGALADAQSPHAAEAFLADRERSSVASRARAEAVERAEALRAECEWGLRLVRGLMAYLLCVSAAVGVATGVCEWIIIEARRGSLERDWWKCLCDDTVVAHWVLSAQRQEIPGVLAAMMVQSSLLAWVALILTQRACIRMDWISSAIVNVAFTALLVLLPPFTAA